MRVFYGAAIQGARNREKRAHVNSLLIDVIKVEGYDLVSEHTAGRTIEETAALLEKSIGVIPPPGLERKIFIREKMIEFIESDIRAAVFEVSTPSLGTGIEIAHAYLRPRMGLTEIPILALYEKGFWPNNLSTMIRGITSESMPLFQLKEYTAVENAECYLRKFIESL